MKPRLAFERLGEPARSEGWLPADDALITSLRQDEARRRRRQAWVAGCTVLGLLVAGALTWWVLRPDPLLASLTPAEAAAGLTAEGWQRWNSEQLLEARVAFERALRMDENSPEAWNGLGWTRFRLDNDRGAQEAFERCLRLKSEHAAALNGLGRVHYNRGAIAEAERYWLRSAAAGAPAAWSNLAQLYLYTGRFGEAVPWVEKYLAQQPDDAFHRQLSDAARRGAIDESLRRRIGPRTRS